MNAWSDRKTGMNGWLDGRSDRQTDMFVSLPVVREKQLNVDVCEI